MRFDRFWLYRRILLSSRFAACLWRSRQNILADRQGRPPVSGPFMAELDVTYRCDCRCRMCQRWRDHRRGELTLGEYERLADVFRRMGVQLVSIAGGEPLLREDIFSIIRCFAKYGMCVNLCTNGLSVEEHVKSLSYSGASCVTVSVDGAAADTHDTIRGVPGSYERIERGVRRLMASSPHDRPLVRVRMTVSNRNVDEVKRYYRKWSQIADDVLFQPAHFCTGAFYTGLDKETFGLDPVRLARQIDGTPLRKGKYLDGLIRSLRQDGVYPAMRCYAGTLMVRIDPWGSVYPCLEQHVCVGSVREQGFRTIWYSELFNHTRKEIARNGDCRCWYNNTAMISHYAKVLSRLTTVK
ncbi:MAG: radical SAM protein [Deltaproteobacteria bacterium]|nr:radical SAM protein [Deltaproteobacteria bacterium]